MTDEEHSQHPKPVIRVYSRPTSLEEDEWAFKWVLQQWKSAYTFGLGCLSFVILFMVGSFASVGFFNFGMKAGFAVLAIGIAAWVALLISFIRRRRKAPSVIAGKPLGKIETLSLPIEKAWRVDTSKLQTKFNGHFWVFRIIPGVNGVLFIDSTWKPQPFVSGTMPGTSIEIDYYLFEERSPVVKLRIRHVFAVRIEGEPDAGIVDADPVEMPVMCYWLCTSQSRTYDEDHPINPAHAVESLLFDLEHPANRDFCTVIRDDNRK